MDNIKLRDCINDIIGMNDSFSDDICKGMILSTANGVVVYEEADTWIDCTGVVIYNKNIFEKFSVRYCKIPAGVKADDLVDFKYIYLNVTYKNCDVSVEFVGKNKKHIDDGTIVLDNCTMY